MRVFIFLCFLFQLSIGICQSSQPFVILVQPIVVCSDEGEKPASVAIPEALIDRAYEKAQIDFVFFEPIYYHNTRARDGDISLNTIVEEATAEGIMRGNGGIVNMFFVNKVDGKKGPLGRGLMDGDITFIALGDPTAKDLSSMEAFVIGHEVGHNLALKHAVIDPNVVDTIPNIQGDGPYEMRIDPKYSLNKYQIEEIHKSPLVHPRIEFLNTKKGSIGILDESFESYFSRLERKEIYVFTGKWSDSETIEEARDFARREFQSAVTSFSEKEKECITYVISEILAIMNRNDLQLFYEQPWQFIKTEDWLCGGFAHTRGTHIILSEKYLSHYTKLYDEMTSKKDSIAFVSSFGSLLVHEQMHSLQRTYPNVFKKLYAEYWSFIEGQPEDTKYRENQLLNPDAPFSNWLYTENENLYWVRVFINEKAKNPIMGADFIDTVFEIEIRDGEYVFKTDKEGNDIQYPLSEFKQYCSAFPITRGLDHPNEISAYMFSEYFKSIFMNEKAFNIPEDLSKENIMQFLLWIEEVMKKRV